MKKLTLTLASLFLFSAVAIAGEFPKVGENAPAFQMKSNELKDAKLADYRGKWVVLYFYPKDFTKGCTIQAQNFQRDLDKYTERNAVILGVSLDSAESHKEFCTKEALKFTLLSDSDGSVSTAYNSVMEHEGQKYSARNTFLIDPEGKVARVFEKVKPMTHSEEVLAALDELKTK